MLDLVIGHLNNPGNAATLTAKGLDVAATTACGVVFV